MSTLKTDSCKKINTLLGGLLPPPQIIFALESGDSRLFPSRVLETLSKKRIVSGLPDRKTLQKIDKGYNVSESTKSKILNHSELEEAIRKASEYKIPNAAPATMFWSGFAIAQKSRLMLPTTIDFITEGVEAEIRIQTGSLRLVDAIEDLALAGIERHYVGERVAKWVTEEIISCGHSLTEDQKVDIIKSDMGALFLTEMTVSSTIAFLLRYELDVYNFCFPDGDSYYSLYTSRYFSNDDNSKGGINIFLDFWKDDVSNSLQRGIYQRDIAEFMPGDNDIDEKKRQLRSWRSGKNQPSDLYLSEFLTNAATWHASIKPSNVPYQNTAAFLYIVARIYLILDDLKRDSIGGLFTSSGFKASYSRQAGKLGAASK